jgi:tetratricopeptide (TPR) repeat protein
MSEIDWLDVLDWDKEELEDLRFVGYSYLKQGKYDISITFFKALVILNPNNAYDLRTLGALYLQKGNNLMALNYLEKALKLEPNHDETILNRIKALFGLGYKRQAMSQAQALEKNPNPEIANQASSLILANS